MSLRALSLFVVLAAAPLAFACGEDQPADHPPPAGQCPYGSTFDGTQCVPAATGQGGAGATGQGGTGQAGAAQGGAAQGGAAAGGGTGTGVPPEVVGTLLEPLKVQYAMPGAQPVSSPVSATLGVGQTVELTFQAQPGKCYTVIAAGTPVAISEVNAQLLPAANIPGLPAAVLGEDKLTGPTAVIGQQPSCYKWAFPFAGPLKAVATVAAGQGAVALQVYEK